MIAALIVVFREVIEAGLIVGIVLAATEGVLHRGRWVCFGIAGGVTGSGLVAAFAGWLSEAFAGSGQEMFNAAILAVAVAMLTWHNVWMARHGKAMASEIRQVGEQVAAGERTLAALAIVVGVAVLREGSEVVLFLSGIALSAGTDGWAMAAGGTLGLALGAGVAALLYAGLLRIPARHLFNVTSWLITLLAAGMAAQAAAFLQQAGLIDSLADTVWDTSAILSEDSLAGKVLHALVGYTDRPSALQLWAYLATIGAIAGLTRFVDRGRTGASAL